MPTRGRYQVVPVLTRSPRRQQTFSAFRSSAGVLFEVDAAFLPSILRLTEEVRESIALARGEERLTCYVSVPISGRGGGHVPTNLCIAEHIADAVSSRFGDHLWVLNPGAYTLPNLEGERPSGGEYMAVWSDVIAGPDGDGTPFDMIYFAGPNDIWSYFGLGATDSLGDLDRWVTRRALEDPDFHKHIEEEGERAKFLRYYGIRGSASYSKGAHDEWNIVVGLNAKRDTGEDIAIYYDGQPIEPGDYDDYTDTGYQVGR